ncbi:MAG: DUF6249 domain-containing protein [Candidatus Kryptoniota bacterium]
MEDILGQLTGIIAIILIFGATPALIVVIYHLSRKSKHKERMALIEKGVDASIFMKEETISDKVLIGGLFIFGLGLGLLLGYILSVFTPLREEFIMPTTALLFSGLGLIGFYVYRKKTEAKSVE